MSGGSSTDRVYEAAELLSKLRDSFAKPETVLSATLALVAGQPARRAAEALTTIRAELKHAGLAGDSSVGTIRAACQALADAFGPDTRVQRWRTAADARRAQGHAERHFTSDQSAEARDREIKVLAKRVLKLSPAATDEELIAKLRSMSPTGIPSEFSTLSSRPIRRSARADLDEAANKSPLPETDRR